MKMRISYLTKNGESDFGKQKIFLSYRKIDLAYAEQAIDDIFASEFGDEVGIWIDKNIHTGENFDDEIKKALSECRVMVLIVTPNILARNPDGEYNYVYKYEYQYAKDHNMAVIPIMFVDTDLKRFNEMYDNRQFIKWRGENYKEKLASDLKAVIVTEDEREKMRKARLEKEQTIENTYLIGKSYLLGIDCEVNNELALDMITTAAKQDYFDAAKQLAKIYSSGLGVKIDYNKAIEWQEKAAEIAKKDFDKEKTFEKAEKYYWSLISFGIYCKTMGQLEKSEKAESKALSFAKEYSKTNKSNDVLSWVATGLNNLANTKYNQGKLDEAEKLYNDAIEIKRELVKEAGTVEDRSDLAQSLNNLALTKDNQGKLGEAEELYNEAIKIRRELVKETDTVEARSDLAMSLNNLANTKYNQGKLDEAEKLHNEAITIRRELVKETGTVEARYDLASSLNNFANTKKIQGKLDEAEKLHNEAIKIRRELVNETGTVEARSSLADSLNNLAITKKNQGKLDETEKLYNEAIKIRRELVSETGTVKARSSLADNLNNLAITKKKQGKIDEEKKLRTEAKKLYKELFDETGLKQYKDKIDIIENAIKSLIPKCRTKRFFAGLFGIIGILLPPLGIIFGIISICLGSSAKKKSGKGKFAITLGVIGLVLSVLLIALSADFYFIAPDEFNKILSDLQSTIK